MPQFNNYIDVKPVEFLGTQRTYDNLIEFEREVVYPNDYPLLNDYPTSKMPDMSGYVTREEVFALVKEYLEDLLLNSKANTIIEMEAHQSIFEKLNILNWGR